jgi:hypothetical protein
MVIRPKGVVCEGIGPRPLVTTSSRLSAILVILGLENGFVRNWMEFVGLLVLYLGDKLSSLSTW